MKDKKTTNCAICNAELDDFYTHYPNPVCKKCGAKAVNKSGNKPEFKSASDTGDNPVFIDGIKCWRRYRFGGFVTMRDNDGCKDETEFFIKNKEKFLI